jgi:hypothetical protein
MKDMGIFDKIKGAIWGTDEPEAPKVSPASTVDATKPARTASSGASPIPQPAKPASPRAGAPATPTPAAPSAAPESPPPARPGAAAGPVDVAAMLDAAVKRKGQKLDWRRSIVDLMKALDLDSSLKDRKELAAELNYTGDTGDSARMNMWLHKALMKKLAENGGKVPADLLD